MRVLSANIVSAMALVGTLVGASQAHANDAWDIIKGVAGVDAKGLTVTGVVSGGAGCPQGSVNVTLSPDAKVFTVLYDQLSVQVGPGVPKKTVECNVKININKPMMLGFQVESADFRGFVSLDPGVIARQQVTLSGGSIKEVQQISADFGQQTWSGPIQSDYVLSTVHPTTAKILACAPPKDKTTIMIKTKLAMAQQGNPAGQGLIAVDSTDGLLVQRYRMKWVNCNKEIGGLIGGILNGAKKPK